MASAFEIHFIEKIIVLIIVITLKKHIIQFLRQMMFENINSSSLCSIGKQ